ncbi:MAG: oligosaccharide flippase family protein [Candidatus Roizmanbacteria bacterium]|nr:oligosaccharide flippase family protein [Candidatus Roizmanbacteria bacterium]
MRTLLQNLFRNNIVKGTSFVFIGSFAANLFNYFFHLITGRMLGPEQYAIVAALLSLSYVFGFPSLIISTVITRKIAELAALDDKGGINGVLRLVIKFLSGFIVIFTVFLFLFQKTIAEFLNIENTSLIVILGLSLAISYFSTIGLSVLQGMLRFMSYAVVSAIGGFFKDFFALGAVLLGLGAPGVIWSFLATSIATTATTFIPLKDILIAPVRHPTIGGKSISSTFWVASAFFGMGLMINTDVLVVKHFFSPYEAGLYAALATMGKIVLFLSSSIATVLLPVATQKNARGHSTIRELALALGVILLLSVSVIGVFALLPRLVIYLLYGEAYYPISRILWLMGVYFLFYNISNTFIHYFISIKRYRILMAALVVSAVQVGLLFMFHKSFEQIVLVLVATALLLCLIFIYHYISREIRKK